jgi:DNA gyrase/topoisomerase IV subunit A
MMKLSPLHQTVSPFAQVNEISTQGRAATGVRLMNVDEGQSVASVAPILSVDDE